MGVKEGKRVRKLVPAIHNLVFVHSTRKRIDALKEELECRLPIRFIMNREFCRPVVIPDVQMRVCPHPSRPPRGGEYRRCHGCGDDVHSAAAGGEGGGVSFLLFETLLLFLVRSYSNFGVNSKV